MVSKWGIEWFKSFKQSLPETATLYLLAELPFVFVLNSSVMFQVKKPFQSEIPFGLEVGAGSMPTKVYNVDRQLPWILTECALEQFKELIKDLPKHWEEALLGDLPEPVIVMRTFAAPELQLQAHFLIYQNPDYERGDFFLVRRTDLKPNQKLMLIVSGSHTTELDRYRELLKTHGYDDSKLRRRDSSEVSLTFPIWEEYEPCAEYPWLSGTMLDEFKLVYSFEATGSDLDQTPSGSAFIDKMTSLWKVVARHLKKGMRGSP